MLRRKLASGTAWRRILRGGQGAKRPCPALTRIAQQSEWECCIVVESPAERRGIFCVIRPAGGRRRRPDRQSAVRTDVLAQVCPRCTRHVAGCVSRRISAGQQTSSGCAARCLYQTVIIYFFSILFSESKQLCYVSMNRVRFDLILGTGTFQILQTLQFHYFFHSQSNSFLHH